jgi:hypothetical protein
MFLMFSYPEIHTTGDILHMSGEENRSRKWNKMNLKKFKYN